jgi:hypothetical protein
LEVLVRKTSIGVSLGLLVGMGYALLGAWPIPLAVAVLLLGEAAWRWLHRPAHPALTVAALARTRTTTLERLADDVEHVTVDELVEAARYYANQRPLPALYLSVPALWNCTEQGHVFAYGRRTCRFCVQPAPGWSQATRPDPPPFRPDPGLVTWR